MKSQKTNTLKNILLYCGLALVITITIITAIVVHHQKKKLDDLNDKNQQIEDSLDNNTEIYKENKIFFKNLLNFIDK